MSEQKDFAQYANPQALVSTEWVAEHKDDQNVVSWSPMRMCCSTRPGISPGR